MLSILFKSHLIRHSGTRRAFKDTQSALEQLRHSENTQALGHLRHSGTWALGHLEHLETRALGHLGTRDTLFYKLFYITLVFSFLGNKM